MVQWRARVEATAAELAATAFYAELLRVLEAADLPYSHSGHVDVSEIPHWPESKDIFIHGVDQPSPSSQQQRQRQQQMAPTLQGPGHLAGAARDGSAALPPLLRGLQAMVIYGLGSLEQPGGIHIRCQCALALRLAALLQPRLASPPEAFDPVFTGLDRSVLQALGIAVLQEDEGGARVAGVPTLFYLPHCEDSLTDALLAANVAAGTLCNCVLLGNRLSIYPERWGEGAGASSGAASARGSGNSEQCGRSSLRQAHWREVRPRPDMLLALCAAGAVLEVPVHEQGYPVVSAFNDLALHTFAADWRERLMRADGEIQAQQCFTVTK